MKEFATYSLQANVLLIVSYLFYRLLLSNESSFKANRIYFFLSVIISLTVPLVKLPSFIKPLTAQVNLSEVVIHKMNYYSPTLQTIHSSPWAILYFSGVIIAATLFFINILQIFFLIFKGISHKRNGYVLIQSQKAKGIFSFLKFIVIPVEKEYKETEIMQHEVAHIRQLHSLDVLFFEALSILFWYNPVCYLYKVAVKENHEFLADNAVVKEKNNPVEYAKLITSYALYVTPYTLSGNFISRSF